MWSLISSLIGIRSSSPLAQQLVAQIRSLRDANAKFYTSVSKHPEDPAYLQCAALVAMIDMATWINQNHDRVMEDNIRPVEFDAMLQDMRAWSTARAAASELSGTAPVAEKERDSDEFSFGYESISSDSSNCSDEAEPDKHIWTVVHERPTPEDLDEHDPQACPLSASSCWICSDLFEVRHHPRHSNVDWDSGSTESAKFSTASGEYPAGPRGVELHDSILDALGERCPITRPELCWVCCLSYIKADTELMSISLD
jgi:hypothetical protein